MQELFSIADEICLQVPDMDMLIEKLNDAGHLLKKGGRQYQVHKLSMAYVISYYCCSIYILCTDNQFLARIRGNKNMDSKACYFSGESPQHAT